MQNTENREMWTASYTRLSIDERNVGESMRSVSQKSILIRNAEEISIQVYKFYLGGRYSSTKDNRPSFQQTIADVILHN